MSAIASGRCYYLADQRFVSELPAKRPRYSYDLERYVRIPVELPGHFYDYFERRYVSVPAERPGLAERHNRRFVVQHLINDAMENDYPIAHLYALLLVR